MGYNTTVIVMNDALHYIEEDKDFGKNLSEAIRYLHSPRAENNRHLLDIPAGCHANAATAVETHHADVTSVVAVGGNCATVMGQSYGFRHHSDEDKIRILKDLAADLGYNLVKKPQKKS